MFLQQICIELLTIMLFYANDSPLGKSITIALKTSKL